MSGFDTLKNKKILVVGATGGLGSAIARFLSTKGAALFVSGRNQEALSVIAQDLGVDSLALNLNNASERVSLVDTVGALDGVVYAAGVSPVAPVRYLKDAEITTCLDLNTIVPLLLVRDLLKQKKLNAGASIVWLSSVASSRGTAGYAAY